MNIKNNCIAAFMIVTISSQIIIGGERPSIKPANLSAVESEQWNILHTSPYILREESTGRPILERLLETGYNINHINPGGWTLLNKACGVYSQDIQSDPLWMINFLLEHGADPNINKDQQNVLLSAAARHYTDIVIALIGAGADYSYTNSFGHDVFYLYRMEPGRFANDLIRIEYAIDDAKSREVQLW